MLIFKGTLDWLDGVNSMNGEHAHILHHPSVIGSNPRKRQTNRISGLALLPMIWTVKKAP
jgi:hypothetical protein